MALGIEVVSRKRRLDGLGSSTLVRNLQPPDNYLRLWKTSPWVFGPATVASAGHVEDTFSAANQHSGVVHLRIKRATGHNVALYIS